MLLNTGVAVALPQIRNYLSFPNIRSISRHLPDTCQIARHFQVFYTSGHPEIIARNF